MTRLALTAATTLTATPLTAATLTAAALTGTFRWTRDGQFETYIRSIERDELNPVSEHFLQVRIRNILFCTLLIHGGTPKYE